MITFKCIADLAKLHPDDPAHAVILDLLHQFPRDPESQGYIVLLQPGETHVTLPELKGCIAGIGWDGVYRRDYFWIAVRLTNNEFALEFVIPDAGWLDADLRESLEAQSEYSESYMRSTKDPPF